MTSTVLTGISELWTLDPALDDPARPGDVADAQVLRYAAVVIEEGRIAWTGPAADAPAADAREDLGGRAVLPGWVDSHSHLVFDGDRAAEFEARMAGRSYSAGGIAVTTDATRAAADARLRDLVRDRIAEAVAGGTTCLETKTGYGLTVADELRAAQLLDALIAEGALDEATFLGAHLVPREFDGEDGRPGAAQYVDLVAGEMLAAVAEHVRWIDVFCEDGAFDPEQSAQVLRAGAAAGLGLRVHGHQLGRSGGVALAAALGAASVDHVNHLAAEDVEALAATAARPTAPGDRPGLLAVDAGPTVATVLPACDLSTRAPLAPARELLDAGAAVAIASNCNPGTSYTSAMSFCVTTAVLQMHLSLGEAVRAATRGGALALRRGDVGHLGVGARADLHVLDAPAAIHLAYRPGMPMTHRVWRHGQEQPLAPVPPTPTP
ncbi:imidazolonepropionase [Brachybacterium saurashtrense]|uniref:Imidazolonepropionase n=1 Tax=Brachybacterium saurashtrense TaxID=556288 RepID=A0A345YRB1_9MICO|nr:imidazolonepropionase [Brachybacterium saurashtrense]AXK46463.1 imidazolonepropionase [Brachybacterium saurashtrense]RRR24204.1 imidazolonepropionase [Brachybacterium saurashtrense]